MSDIVIRVENLSKAYQINHAGSGGYRTLREDLLNLAKHPLSGKPDGQKRETVWALKDVVFEVKEGEILGVIGRNGAGKSTLLKILSRITEPTSGYADIFGRVGSLLEVGTGFHGELTGRENIYLSGAILGMRRHEIDRRFDEIVAFAEVEQYIDTPVKRYSSGMYMRLAFAVAAHLEPEILLVDEVLAVGDAIFQKKCLGKMGDVAREGRTVLFVSHTMPAILSLCSKGILLEMGQINQIGNIQQVVDSYLNGAMNQEGSVTFSENTRNNELRFVSVAVLDNNGRPTPYADLLNGVNLQIEYEVFSSVRTAQIAIELWNAASTCILSSTDFDMNSDSRTEVKQPGRYLATCSIPSGFLRPGRYWIDLSSSIIGIKLLDRIEHAISFEVIDPGASIEFKLSQGRRGVIAPILPWETEILRR